MFKRLSILLSISSEIESAICFINALTLIILSYHLFPSIFETGTKSIFLSKKPSIVSFSNAKDSSGFPSSAFRNLSHFVLIKLICIPQSEICFINCLSTFEGELPRTYIILPDCSIVSTARS